MPQRKKISVHSELSEGFRVHATIRGHEVLIDQPGAAGGTDSAPTPLELYLFSLGGCVASIAQIKAKQEGITLRSMSVEVSGGLNPAVLLGKPSDDRCGFEDISIAASIDADLGEEEKRTFLDEVCARCPLHDNTVNSTSVRHQLLD